MAVSPYSTLNLRTGRVLTTLPIVGWEATNMVRVTISDTGAVGDIVDAAMQAGANRIDGISFRVDDRTAAEAAARVAAVTDPDRKAGQLAAAAGPHPSGLISLREITRGRLVCVFGCGGDRDRGKRPRMGETAGALADRIVVTSDNPRSEDPEAIIAEILAGLRPGGAAGPDVETDVDTEPAPDAESV